MNINSFNPVISNIHTQNTLNERKKFNNLSPLAQDTISFGSSASAKKMVEKLKTYNPNGQYDIKQTEAEAIYRYFGFEVENGKSAHKTITGPYGQTFTYSSQTIIDPSHASALIRGIQMADEFNGELMLFPNKPKEEVVQKWKQRISERRPTKGFENSYAIDNKEKLEALLVRPKEETTTVEESKEQEKAINELKIKISNFSKQLEEITDDFDATKELFEETKTKATNHKVELPQETLAELDAEIKKKGEEISTAKESVENYDKKLSKGFLLSEEETKKLNSYQKLGDSLSGLLNKVVDVEQICMTEIGKQDALVESILAAIKKFGDNAELLNAQASDIKNIIDEASTYTHFRRSLIQELYSLHSSLEKKLAKISAKVEGYKEVKTTKEPISKLKAILNKIKEYNNGGLGKSIPELIELNKIIETEIKPILTVSEDVKKAKTLDRIEKFNKKVEYAQSHKAANTPKEIETEPEHQIIEQLEIQIPEESIIPETTPIEQKLEVPPEERTTIDLLQEKTKQFKSKLASTISPLPIVSVESAISKLVDENFDAIVLSKVKENNTTTEKFTKELTSTIAKSPEFKRIKHATRFAFLNSVYSSSNNKPSEIFTLNSKQTKYVFEAIKNGQRKIEVQTDATPISISLPQDYDINSVDKLFEKYNTKTIDQPKEIGKRIADEILKYAPNFSTEEFHQILIDLSQEGSYYELLTNDNCNETLKTTLLKTFWGTYDKAHGTNFESQVLQNIEDEQKKIKAAEMQKRKLESIKKMDWSL